MTGSPQPNLADLDLDTRYSPAVIDRFARLVDRLPLPAWAFYLALFAGGYLLFAAGRWIAGQRDPGFIAWPAPALVWDVSILALHQYLDGYALTSLRRFNRALGASEDDLQRLGNRLTTLPARYEIAGAGFWVLLASVLTAVQLSSFREYFAPWELAVSILSFLIGGAFFAHVIYQLRLVSRIHASAREIDLFDPEPLYSFSGLTVRTAIGFVLIQYLVVLALPSEIRTSTVLVPVAAVVALAVLVFVWPLWGMHRRLEARKHAMEGDISGLLKKSVARVTDAAVTGVVEDPETLEKTLGALRAAQATVADLSTWPWQPSAVRGLATALLLPIVIFLLQQMLARLAGF
ncbi:MAG: hypothetical protein R2844_11930 [Caldilineales bacterium]